jgi:hypothetical protein
MEIRITLQFGQREKKGGGVDLKKKYDPASNARILSMISALALDITE